MVRPAGTFKRASAVALLALTIPLATLEAQASARSGQQVVEAVCASCHATGANGAPRIGDENAWKARAAQGLTSLTGHAIQGIRKMPAHGGNPGVSNFEIELAITYMVNHSGGHWATPIDKSAPMADRTGEQIVQAQCVKCHAAGVDGAPRIGDRSAWIPRLKQGLDALVRSATRGHGGMPARGGMADLTDTELRSAIVYMIDQGVAPAKAEQASAAAPIARPGGDHQVIAGTEIYLGVISAETLRGENLKASSAESTMHGGIPAGKGYYHVNVSLFDSKTGAPIADAKVKATVSDPVMGGETKTLELMATPPPSYGNYFRISGVNPHTITVHIRRPDGAREITAKFDFER
jgi:cytochrome c5